VDQRLLCVASMVRQGAALADIGTDHAYLPVHLTGLGHIRSAIAADIGEGPAAAARLHIAQAGLQDAIEVRVCDGLSGIRPHEVTDIVIAGMGGETIIHILEEAPWVADADVKLILQPMTKTVELRRWLFEHGFSIQTEHLIEDGRHLYLAMAAQYDGTVRPTDGWEPYVGALDAAEGRPYFEKQCHYLQKRIEGLQLSGRPDEAQALQRIQNKLQQMMNEG